MFLKILLCYLVVSSVNADELRVAGRHQTYRLNWDEKTIDFEAPTAKLKFELKSCNKQIFERFSDNMKKISGAAKVRSNQADLQYTLNGKTHKIRQKSRTGLGLLKLPEEIRRMKIEEALACKST